MNAVHRLPYATLIGLLAVNLWGCGSGGPRHAPVSGVLTVNGKPFKHGVVTFQPVGTKDNPNPGRGSSSYTDDNGRFALKTDEGKDGAVVGKHRVRESGARDDAEKLAGWDYENRGTPDSGDLKVKVKAKTLLIPPEWNAESTKEFDVPVEGTDKANFDIVTKKK